MIRQSARTGPRPPGGGGEAFLALRSGYSLLRGTAAPEALAERAAALGYAAAGLVDRQSIAGGIRFADAAARIGLKPLIGAEIGGGEKDEGEKEGGMTGPSLLIFPGDPEGFANLCRILTAIHLAAEPPADPVALIAENARGLRVICDAAGDAARILDAIGPERVRIRVKRPGHTPAEEKRIIEFARRLDIPIVAAPDAYWSDGEGFLIHRVLRHRVLRHRVLRAIDANTTLARVRPPLCAPAGCGLPSPAELRERYRDLPEAIDEARRIAEDARFSLPAAKPIFPPFALPEEETPFSRLYALATEGLARRGDPIDARYVLRLTRELEVIESLGLSTYILVVESIVRLARERGIPISARGSAAGSLVAYALGISGIDPIAFGLSFERFLNPLRDDLPDIDLDVCWVRRDSLIDEIFRRFDPSRVAMVATYPTFRPRSAFREAARALGIEARAIGRAAAGIPDAFPGTLREAIAVHPAARAIPWADEPFRSILPIADGLIGIPRHLSIHTGGIAIADREIGSVVPLARAPKGVIVTQLDMHGIERLGLVKIDLLGSRALTEVDEAAARIRERRGISIDPASFPDGDAATRDLVSEGRTIGIFQIESPAMRGLLRMLRVGSIREAIAAIALVRPGPSWAGTKEAFIRRANGEEVPSYALPALREALAASQGMILFEEDAMAVASAVAGLDGAAADALRRALKGSGDEDRLRALADDFLRAAIENGVPAGAARRAWDDLVRFSGYTYNKAHATVYGHLAWRLAYLKARFPQEFFAAVLNHHAGLYATRTLLEEAKRCGVAILPPCIRASQITFEPEGDGIRVPLSRVKGLRGASIRRIIDGRPFVDPDAFFRRARIPRREIESLILCGALDAFGIPRPRLIHRLEAGSDRPEIEDFPASRNAAEEMRILDFTIGPHPMAFLRADAEACGCIPAAAVPSRAGERVAVAGLLAARKETETQRSRDLAFVTIEDETGLAEGTIFPAVYRRLAPVLSHLGPFRFEGVVEARYGAVSLIADRIDLFRRARGPLTSGVPAGVESRPT
ncbi:MAG: DNA polymerase III subunit alpha [Planctomycetes bacterium]|nr:DNA polymerase III subunit alpha [Planctomycetota bacterium]